MVVRDWLDTIALSIQGLWGTVLGFLPSLVGAIVILIVGLIVAAVIERVVERIAFYLKVDQLLRRLGFEDYLDRANVKLNSGHFLGRIVYWFLVIAFLLAASETLGFIAFSNFLQNVLNFIPNILVASLILVATLVAAHFLQGLVRASVLSAKLHSAHALGTLTWWVVFIFGFLTVLLQLGVAVQVINTLITGIIAMLALAGGLAFGLGGRDIAGDALKRLRDKIMK